MTQCEMIYYQTLLKPIQMFAAVLWLAKSGTLFITDASGRRLSHRTNQSTTPSGVCVEQFRERQDDLFGTCYMPRDPRVRRYGVSDFLFRPLRELDCSRCRSSGDVWGILWKFKDVLFGWCQNVSNVIGLQTLFQSVDVSHAPQDAGLQDLWNEGHLEIVPAGLHRQSLLG